MTNKKEYSKHKNISELDETAEEYTFFLAVYRACLKQIM